MHRFLDCMQICCKPCMGPRCLWHSCTSPHPPHLSYSNRAPARRRRWGAPLTTARPSRPACGPPTSAAHPPARPRPSCCPAPSRSPSSAPSWHGWAPRPAAARPSSATRRSPAPPAPWPGPWPPGQRPCARGSRASATLCTRRRWAPTRPASRRDGARLLLAPGLRILVPCLRRLQRAARQFNRTGMRSHGAVGNSKAGAVGRPTGDTPRISSPSPTSPGHVSVGCSVVLALNLGRTRRSGCRRRRHHPCRREGAASSIIAAPGP
jgi:hypothetical protein